MYSALLEEFSTSGISAAGAKAQKVSPGPSGSHRLALIDLQQLLKYEGEFRGSALWHRVPAALLAAICSRETHGLNIVGDGGNGLGLMQIDKRYHTFARTGDVMTPDANIQYAAQLLTNNWQYFCKEATKQTWTYAEKLRAAVCAYNAGLNCPQTWANMDIGTTQNDYSADVWERARVLLPYFKDV